MNDLLTTRQLMDLLQLDRTTIYRMLNEGRLPGVRVGGQWRFSRRAIDLWLQEQNPEPADLPEAPDPVPPLLSSDVLPLHCLAPIQDVFAQTAGIAGLTTDMDGVLLTPVSNACAFCEVVRSTDKGRARCTANWRWQAMEGAAPRLETCHAGLTYARGRIAVQGAFVAMFFGGQFTMDRPSSVLSRAHLEKVARACEVEPARLGAAAREVHMVEKERAVRLLSLIQKVADTFSTIGQERLDLLSRLKKVADIAGGIAV